MGVLWTCLAIHTQSDTTNSQKTFIFSEQINFIPHVFLKIFRSKNQNRNARTRILPNMGLLVKYQQQYQLSFKIMSKKISLNKILINFLKTQKKNYFGTNLGRFGPNLVKNEFSWKRGLSQFLNIPIIYHYVKNQRKLMNYS